MARLHPGALGGADPPRGDEDAQVGGDVRLGPRAGRLVGELDHLLAHLEEKTTVL